MKLRTAYLTLLLLASIAASLFLTAAARANGTTPPPATPPAPTQTIGFDARQAQQARADADAQASGTGTASAGGGAAALDNRSRALAIGLGAAANPSASNASGCLAVGNKLRSYGWNAFTEGDPVFQTEEVCALMILAVEYDHACQYKNAAEVRLSVVTTYRPELAKRLEIPAGEINQTAKQCADAKRPPPPPAPPAPPAAPASAPKADKNAAGPCGKGKTLVRECRPVK